MLDLVTIKGAQHGPSVRLKRISCLTRMHALPASPSCPAAVKIGRPGYRVTKQYDPETRQRSLLFQVGEGSGEGRAVLRAAEQGAACHSPTPRHSLDTRKLITPRNRWSTPKSRRAAGRATASCRPTSSASRRQTKTTRFGGGMFCVLIAAARVLCAANAARLHMTRPCCLPSFHTPHCITTAHHAAHITVPAVCCRAVRGGRLQGAQRRGGQAGGLLLLTLVRVRWLLAGWFVHCVVSSLLRRLNIWCLLVSDAACTTHGCLLLRHQPTRQPPNAGTLTRTPTACRWCSRRRGSTTRGHRQGTAPCCRRHHPA
jgi:hypothetical protein